MKKFLLLFLMNCMGILIGYSQQQQLSTLAFEEWTNLTGCTAIDSASHFTNIDIERYRLANSCTTTPGVIKSTDKYAGTYAMKLISSNISGNHFSTEVNLAQSVGGNRFDFTSNPVSLKGYYKFTKAGTDTVSIVIKTFASSVEKGTASFVATTSTTGYQSFEIPITYVDATTTDELFLQISLGNTNGDADPNSILLIDAFEFNYTPLSTISYNQNASITLYANENAINFSENVSEVSVFNTMGANVIQYNDFTNTINHNQLKNGVYIVTYKYKNNYYSSKIILE